MGKYLVVGGTKGIGLATVTKLIEEGNQVIVMARNINESLPASVDFISWDAGQQEFPTIDIDHLDGLVYAPGTINLKPFGRLKEEDFQNDWNVNVMGAVKALQSTLPILKKSSNGSVVLFSTVAVSKGMAYHASVSSSKGAIEGLARSLASEFAPHVRVNCIAPSITDTPLASRILANEDRKLASGEKHPMKRVGEAEDIANMALFLLGNESTWISGQVLHVDGGMGNLE